MAQEDVFKKIVAHCKEYGFVFPSSEIYDGLGAVYDYGQLGVEMKNNIKTYWWQSMVLLHDNIVGIDSAIFMHPTIWKASGHVDAFNDPLIDNRDSKKRYRADVLIEDQIAKYDEKIEKEVAKAAKRFGDSFDEAKYRATSANVLEHAAKRDALHERYKKAMNDGNLDELKQIILDEGIVCPISGTRNWTDVRQFNLMFQTEMGSTADGAMKIYLRPETAQGIFVNYLNVQKTGRMKIPFGIAQIGKAFRNEIVARQFIFRMREFEQMEMQFFIKPGTELDWFAKWKETRMKWHQALGFGADHYRFHDHDKLAHYANALGIIAFELHLGCLEIIARVVFVVERYGADIKHFDLVQYLAVVLCRERKHLQHRRLGAIVTIFCASFPLCHPDSLMAIFADMLDIFRHEYRTLHQFTWRTVAFDYERAQIAAQRLYPPFSEQVIADADIRVLAVTRNNLQPEKSSVHNDIAMVGHVECPVTNIFLNGFAALFGRHSGQLQVVQRDTFGLSPNQMMQERKHKQKVCHID